MTKTYIHDDIRDALVEAAFAPLDDDFWAEPILTARTRSTLDYFMKKGWDAYRVELDGAAVDGFTLARWSDDGIHLARVNGNGVFDAEARFDATPKGVAWFAAAVAS
jgi:hypothetical protein